MLEHEEFAGKHLMTSLLPILDDLHRTLESDGKGKARIILEGIELIVEKLDKTLEDLSVEQSVEERKIDDAFLLKTRKANGHAWLL